MLRILISGLCFLLPCAITRATELTLSRFVHMAEKHDPQFRSILKDEERGRFISDLNLPGDGVVISLGDEYISGSEDSGKSFSMSAAVSKDFTQSGTRLSFKHNRTRGDDGIEDLSEFRIEQDIFKNALGRDIRKQKTYLEKERQIIQTEATEAYENYLREITEFYIDLQTSTLMLKISENGIDEARQLFHYMKQKQKQNVALQVEVDKAELQFLQRQEDHASVYNTFIVHHKKVESIIGVDDFNLNFQDETFDKADPSEETRMADLRFMRILSLRRDIAQHKIALSDSAQDPSVRLIAGLNIDGSEKTISGSYRKEALVGINLEIPMWDSKLNAEKSKALHDSEKITLDEKLAVSLFLRQKKELQASFEEIRKVSELNQKKTELASRILKAENERFQNGRIEPDRIIELQTALQNARINQQKSQLRYKKQVVRWLALNDLLLKYMTAL